MTNNTHKNSVIPYVIPMIKNSEKVLKIIYTVCLTFKAIMTDQNVRNICLTNQYIQAKPNDQKSYNRAEYYVYNNYQDHNECIRHQEGINLNHKQ